MHIGDIRLILPALYLIVAAIVVLIIGVIAARRPDQGLDHYIPSQYLAPALVVPALILAGGVLLFSLAKSVTTDCAAVYGLNTSASGIGLFVTDGGHAQLTVDPFAAIFSLVAVAGCLIVMLVSLEHFGEHQAHKAEYYALLMFATSASTLAAAASDLIAIYLSIEFLSMTSYVLAAYAKTDRRSAEAGMKYFLYGAAASAVMLYGMSILFGITGGGTALSAIAASFDGAASTGAGWVAVFFVLVGLGFKLALVPFHFWAPDTYEGSPTPVAAFLSVVSKAAGLAVLIRFIVVVALPAPAGPITWYWIMVALTAASMFYGNLVAIPQSNIKRMLAYSSIAQVGYMMIGVLAALPAFSPSHLPGGPSSAVVASSFAGRSWDMQGVLIYVLAYLFMNLGAFAVVVAVGKSQGSDEIATYSGLARRSPFHAAALAVFLVSLAGIPPTAGFLGKLLIFGSAVRVGLLDHPELIVLAALGIANSVISVYYYLNVVRRMYLVESDAKPRIQVGFAANAAIVAALILTIGLIALWKPVSDLTVRAVSGTNIVQP